MLDHLNEISWSGEELTTEYVRARMGTQTSPQFNHPGWETRRP